MIVCAWLWLQTFGLQMGNTRRGSISAPPDVCRSILVFLEPKHSHKGSRLIKSGPACANAAAGDDRHILLAADAIGHRRGRDHRAEIEAPHFLERVFVI